MSGVERIAAERQRQIDAEGWTPEHDDEHTTCELSQAARLYARAAEIAQRAPDSYDSVRRIIEEHGGDPDTDVDYRRMVENPPRHWFGWDNDPEGWPWEGFWNPSPDPIVNLVKAGALIAAEIDRLERSPYRGREAS